MPRKKTEKKTTTPRAVPAKPPEPVPARPAGDKGDAATAYCLIVGCGASAGGLEAFTDLLQHVPENAALAIILIQHLDPTHASVLTELLSRATKMPVVQITDGMHIEASRVYVIPPNTNISVRQGVQDTGTGMDTETRSHIFEPFFTTKPRGTGSGLGLSTTYNIVKQSGGYIAAYSELGVGSTFTVYLPRVEGEPVRAEERPEAEWRGAETVLVVEDENAVRELTRTFLEMRGYRVLEAANGPDALRVSRGYGGPIHLMVTDVVMPRMSGRELAFQLASERPDMKVLYMSGHTEDAIIHHGVLKEGVPFIHKPFTQQALAKEVRRVLDQEPGGAAPSVKKPQ